jgi:hypothetical protein
LSLKALGDKAFYDCNELNVVVFKSYYAPILEEDYDTERLSYDALAMTGRIGDYVGLGIVKYYMWNPTAQYTNFYFGANFVDFIGDIDKNLVMVKPANGQNYKTFIFDQYFKTIVEGSNAATDETINVIALINAIPSRISLDHEEMIMKVRAAYDKITSFEQRAIIGEVYSKLSSAEATLEYLKLNAGQGDSTSSDNNVDTGDSSESDSSSNEEPVGVDAGIIITSCVATVVVCGAGVAAYVLLIKKKNLIKKETSDDTTKDN